MTTDVTFTKLVLCWILKLLPLSSDLDYQHSCRNLGGISVSQKWQDTVQCTQKRETDAPIKNGFAFNVQSKPSHLLPASLFGSKSGTEKINKFALCVFCSLRLKPVPEVFWVLYLESFCWDSKRLAATLLLFYLEEKMWQVKHHRYVCCDILHPIVILINNNIRKQLALI